MAGDSSMLPKASVLSSSSGDELAQIIQSYNEVTERLRESHDLLRSEVSRLELQLASADAQLQRSKRLAALGEMAAGIAHEIRNPLGAIQLYAQMLQKDLTTAAAGEASEKDLRRLAEGGAPMAEKIVLAVRGLNAVVQDVLSFARELKPRITGLPVASLFDRVMEGSRPLLEAAKIVVRKSAAEELMVRGDEQLLQQALMNLVRNAIEAMAGRSDALLTLMAQIDQDSQAWVLLTVRDTGPGIAEEDIDRIFNPFFTTRSTGTGLGLAIVHRIVDAHGGTITVHNDPGSGGAVFELRLPGEGQAR